MRDIVAFAVKTFTPHPAFQDVGKKSERQSLMNRGMPSEYRLVDVEKDGHFNTILGAVASLSFGRPTVRRVFTPLLPFISLIV